MLEARKLLITMNDHHDLSGTSFSLCNFTVHVFIKVTHFILSCERKTFSNVIHETNSSIETKYYFIKMNLVAFFGWKNDSSVFLPLRNFCEKKESINQIVYS